MMKKIKSVFTTVVDWAATLFGMKDGSKFGRVMRRVVACTFAVAVLFWAAAEVVRFFDYIDVDLCELFSSNDDKFYLSQRLSDDVLFYDSYYYGENGYIANADGKKLVGNVLSIAHPLEGDSLVYYSDGERRGYFHMRDGRLVIEPIYEHAWIFSEGLAAVEEQGRIKFIDTAGRVVIDRGFKYDVSDDGYVFHDGHCAVNDSTGRRMGLIDRTGNWVLPPVYSNIYPQDTFWLLRTDDRMAVLTFGMDTVIPLVAASISIGDTAIDVTFPDHTQSQYDLQGKLLVANQIRDVEQLMYDTKELMYRTNRDVDEETESYYSYDEYTSRKAVASCLRYEAEYGWYGLMSPDGRQITPPAYSSIEAISKDLYLCKTDYGRGVILNSKGRRVE